MEQPLHGAERAMYLQRPSSARSQDIAHILARTFRELFTRDVVGQDTVEYLSKSKGGDDEYHETYVESLQKVQQEHERRLAEVAMLERHIMQAQARAMSADERALNRVSSECSRFPDLGLPPSRSHLRSCIDTELLRSHNLVTPEDFATEEPPFVSPPRTQLQSELTSMSDHSMDTEPSVPDYALGTVSSSKKVHTDYSAHLPLEQRHLTKRGSIDTDDISHIQPSPQVPAPRGGRVWTSIVTPEEREEQRAALSHLQAKVNYLKNPRHQPPSSGHGSLLTNKRKLPKEVGIKQKYEPESIEPESAVFLPSPPVIRFTEYSTCQVYEITLELKNVSCALRPVRIIPPHTAFFSVGLGQFPGEQGLVAPGMSCHYTIRFSPDGLADFDDYLTVQTQASAPLIVPLQGRRPPPVLSIPENIFVGHCLVGGCRITQIVVQNEGGPGRFCILKRKSWPASNFKISVPSSSVSMPPMEVRPTLFELKRGEKALIEALFMPTETETYSQQMTIVCDNCHVRHFTITGVGQTAGVELISVDGGLSQAGPGLVCDITAAHMIHFDELNPYTYYQRTMRIKNLADVDLAFSWVVVKPLLEVPDPSQEVVPHTGAQERVQDVDAAFGIQPESGILPASRVSQFIITFAPPKVYKFHSILHLLLRNIPIIASRAVERPASSTSDGIAEIVLPETNCNGGYPTGFHDLTALEIEVRGECLPFSVQLQPYAIFIPGQILMKTSVKRQFKIQNTSISSVIFDWQQVHCDTYFMEVQPPCGELGPHGECTFELTLNGSQAGEVDHTMSCNIEHMEEPLKLHVKADIKGPEVRIENTDVNFGLVQLGEKTQQTVRIHNLCQVGAFWNLEVSPQHQEYDQAAEFTFTPSCGELRPLETLDVTVMFNPRECRSMRTIFELNVKEGAQSLVKGRAEVQTPQACLLECKLTLQNVYVDVPTLHGVTLLNQSLLPTRFEWGQANGEDAGDCRVSVEPASARLENREKLECALTITVNRQGAVKDLRVPCIVAGMEEPLYLFITGDVHGLQVSYTASEAAETPNVRSANGVVTELDFGDTKLGERCCRYLHIYNGTAITAPFNLFIDHLSAKPPTPPEGKPGHKSSASQRRAMISRSAAMTTYKTSASGAAEAKVMLGASRGAAFFVSPSQGVLLPFMNQVIEVTAFSDMWGEYTDMLHCRLENLPMEKIPIRMDVVGCPLRFQVVPSQFSHKPIVRYGTHVSGVKPIVRSMKVNNISPFDIRMDWQVYNEESNKQSTQLVDMLVVFGKPFPLCDQKGNEITPPVECESDVDDDPVSNDNELKEQANDGVTSKYPNKPRPKLIRLVLRKHEGVTSEKPYHIQPKQLVIPGNGNNFINVTMTPTTNVNIGTDWSSFALGYMSLTDEVSRLPEGHVTRGHGYDVAPLRLYMTGHIKPALLTFEFTDEEGMEYHMAASELLCDGQVKEEHMRVCSMRLANRTETPLTFRLLTQTPFYLVHRNPKTNQTAVELLCTDEYTLKPRHNLMAEVGFKLNHDLLTYAKEMTEEIEAEMMEEINEETEQDISNDEKSCTEDGEHGGEEAAERDDSKADENTDNNEGENSDNNEVENADNKEEENTNKEAGDNDNKDNVDDANKLEDTDSIKDVENGASKDDSNDGNHDDGIEGNEDAKEDDPNQNGNETIVETASEKACEETGENDVEKVTVKKPQKDVEKVYEKNGMTLKIRGNERKLHLNQNMIIQFNNGTSQSLPLVASVTVPVLRLSRDEVDFGTCLVGQRREMQLQLYNPTGSSSQWSCIVVSQSENCLPETFEITPLSGILEAYITYVSKHKVLLKVFFTAKHTGEYNIEYVFVGQLAEPECLLKVKAQGSYDGKHEAVFNV